MIDVEDLLSGDLKELIVGGVLAIAVHSGVSQIKDKRHPPPAREPDKPAMVVCPVVPPSAAPPAATAAPRVPEKGGAR